MISLKAVKRLLLITCIPIVSSRSIIPTYIYTYMSYTIVLNLTILKNEVNFYESMKNSVRINLFNFFSYTIYIHLDNVSYKNIIHTKTLFS